MGQERAVRDDGGGHESEGVAGDENEGATGVEGEGVAGDERLPVGPVTVEGDVTHLRSLVVVALGITLGGIVLATLVSPSFVWREHALSNLGVTWTNPGTRTTAVLFNGSLITGSLIGVTVVGLLFRRLERRADRVVLALTGAALASMGLVGVFPQGTTPHFPIAIVFFLLVSVTLWVDGTVRYRAGARRWGMLVLAGGTGNILTWVLWFGLVENPFEGLAIPEMVGATIFGGWLVGFALGVTSERPL